MKRNVSIGVLVLVVFVLPFGVAAAATPTPAPPATPSGRLFFPVFDGDATRMKYNVWLYDLRDRERSLLLENASQPALSHDGKALAWKSWAQDQAVGGLYAASLEDLDGSKWRFAHSIAALRPQFAASDAFFVFDSRAESDRLQRVMRSDGASARSIPRPDMDNKEILGKSAAPVLAGKDDAVQYQGCEVNNCGVWQRGLDGTNPVPIGADTTDQAMQASPDGKRVAFMSYSRDGARDWEVYVRAADGTSVTRLTRRPGIDGLPAWSPDGQWVAFVRETKPGSNAWDIVAVSVDGTGEQKLIDLGALDGRVMGTTPDQGQGWMDEQIAWGP